jgi:cyclopropane fatty-acyl-phospholipid synthase-like methyltransferase
LSWWDLAYISGFTPWDTGSPPSELESLLERGLLKPCRALDVGCGTGGLVVYLAKKGFDVTGVDISAVAIMKARARLVREGVKASLIKMDFTDVGQARLLGRFDLVTDVGCYHSLSQDRRRAYIESLNTVINRGGIYLVWAFTRGSWGPPGVDEHEIDRGLGQGFEIIERHEKDSYGRKMLLYIARRLDNR